MLELMKLSKRISNSILKHHHKQTKHKHHHKQAATNTNTQPRTHNHKHITTNTTTNMQSQTQLQTHSHKHTTNWRPWRQGSTFGCQLETELLESISNPKPEDPQAKSKTTKPTTMAICSDPHHPCKQTIDMSL